MLYKKIKHKLKDICTNEESVKLQKDLRKQQKNSMKLQEDSMKLQEDIYALQQLQPISSDYAIWSSSSIRPSAMVQILNEIIVNKRSTVVEFGCGITTVYIAKILKQYGGHLYAVEDNAEWIEIVESMLQQNDLIDMVTFIHAPLEKSKYSLSDCNWYSEEKIKGFLKNITIDMIIIDGPPAYLKDIELSRYPAVPFLIDQFSDDFCIVLDDIDREGEKTILALWEKKFKISFKRQYIKGSIAISRAKQGFNV